MLTVVQYLEKLRCKRNYSTSGISQSKKYEGILRALVAFPPNDDP